MNFTELIAIDRQRKEPIYLQAANCIIQAIQKGVLPKGYKLPGTRRLAKATNLYTKTIEQVYEELYAQGWVTIKPNSGTYVADLLPEFPTLSRELTKQKGFADQARFEYRKIDLEVPNAAQSSESNTYEVILNDGYPDIRYMPAVELEKNYRLLLKKKQPGKVFNKESPWGAFALRKELSLYLNHTRGLNLDISNVLVSKGNQFSIFLILSLGLQPGDVLVMASLSYSGVNNICRYLGIKVQFVDIDNQGIDADALAAICQSRKVKGIYITPHLHYPTTVKLSEKRRVQISELAVKHRFLVIEDDYDFDFHYKNEPSLPVASYNKTNTVYVGGLNRTIAASLRVSYITGPTDFLAELAKLKMSIDRFSDIILEEALALTLKEKVVGRYRNKAVVYYRQKRDFLLKLLEKVLSRYCHFQVPEGGMAIWLEFIPTVPVDELVSACKKKGLLLPERNELYTFPKSSNGIRIGYGSHTREELTRAITILESVAGELHQQHGISQQLKNTTIR